MDFSGVLLLYILQSITAEKGNSNAGKAENRQAMIKRRMGLILNDVGKDRTSRLKRAKVSTFGGGSN